MGLAFMGDVLEEIRDVGGLVSYSYKLAYGWVPPRFEKHHFYQAVKRMLRTGTIERIYKNRRPYLRVTSQGIKKIVRDFPLFEIAKRKWDGKWTVIIFDIKESERWIRDAFREQLLSLGCGKLQRSVYITPHDITQELREMIALQGLIGMVRVFRAPLLFEENPKHLANRVWKLDKINARYQKMLDEWEEAKRKKLKRTKKERLVRELKAFYFDILVTDPILPKELLPEDWAGEKAHDFIRSLN